MRNRTECIELVYVPEYIWPWLTEMHIFKHIGLNKMSIMGQSSWSEYKVVHLDTDIYRHTDMSRELLGDLQPAVSDHSL